jgi:histidinol-phosphatase (PHP family)
LLIDYHLHNHFSCDSESKTADIVKRAIELGIREICITNHVETFPPKGGRGSFSYKEAFKRFAEIKKDLEEAQKELPELSIKFGIELEYVEEWMDEMSRFVNDMDFDFLIGSVHEVDKANISSSDLCGKLYKRVDEKYAYSKYFDNLYKMIEWGNFSVVGHFDVFKKGGINYYGPFQPEKYKDQIIPILKLMKEKGIGIELNTSGLGYPCNEIFPHPDILKWCLKVGVEHYTIGSDGHTIEEVGQNLDKALTLLKDVRIKTISTYEKGVPTLHNIN